MAEGELLGERPGPGPWSWGGGGWLLPGDDPARERRLLLRDIEVRRARLERRTALLAGRLRDLVDWRSRVRSRPMAALVLAFVAGYLIGRMRLR